MSPPSARDTSASAAGRGVGSWGEAVFDAAATARARRAPLVVGVLEGEGVGPEVIGCALEVLSAVESVSAHRFSIRRGGAIGREAEARHQAALSQEVIAFSSEVFADGGAILAGPGGGRFVYDMRRQFDLFCKVSPIRVSEELIHAGRMKPEHVRGVDILVVRENTSGIYQGRWSEDSRPGGGRRAEHAFSYSESEVRRILEVAARIALGRGGSIAVVYKESGVPSISRLWRDCTAAVAQEFAIRHSLLDIDYAAYRLLQHPSELNVLVAPNLFGDVLSDVGAVLLGSRGLACSANFAANGAAVYQTNHGAAHDLAGTDRANPVGQIGALALLLRESFGLLREAASIDAAVAKVWREGWRTQDLAEPGCRLVGTREMGERCARAAVELWGSIDSNEATAAPGRSTE